MKENRKSERFPLTALAEVELPNGKNVPTYVSNISREGLGIYFREPLKEGTDLNIKLFYWAPTGQMKASKVEGRVRWSKTGFFALGISLNELNRQEHQDLLDWIDQAEEQEGRRVN
jgi:hypothetical protein